MSLAEASSSLAEFAAPHETTTMSAAYVSRSPSRSTSTSVTAVPAGLVRSATARAFVSSVTFGCSSAGPHAEHLGVGLGVHQAREAVAGRAAHAVAVRHVRLVQHHAAGRVERMEPGGGEVVRELLDPRLVRDRRERVGSARRRLGRVLAARAVHLVELLGQRVVGLHLVVADRPRRRDAVVVLQLAEVLLAQAVERRAVELRRAADEVVHLRLERLCRVRVVPGVRRDVAVVDEHVVHVPVLRLAREPVAALEQQDALARRSEVPDERAAAGAAADHDHVVVARS